MSSALSLIVFGQVYFLPPMSNTPSIAPETTLAPTTYQGLSQPQPLRAVRRDDYTYTPGIGGHKVHSFGATWNTARKTCQEEGGNLAIINSVAESELIAKLFGASLPHPASSDSNFAHIGFHDLFEEGEFVTIHNEPLRTTGFYEWYGNGPDNQNGNQNCGAVHKDGRLDDNACSATLGFICEVPYVEKD